MCDSGSVEGVQVLASESALVPVQGRELVSAIQLELEEGSVTNSESEKGSELDSL